MMSPRQLTIVLTATGLLAAPVRPVSAQSIRASLPELARAAQPAQPVQRHPRTSSSHRSRNTGFVLVAVGLGMASTSVLINEQTARDCDSRAPGALCGWYNFGHRAPWLGLSTAAAGSLIWLFGNR